MTDYKLKKLVDHYRPNQEVLTGQSPSDEELARLTTQENYQQLLKLLDQKAKAK